MGKRKSPGAAFIYPDIEFRPLTGIRAQERIVTTELLPSPFRPMALAGASINFRRYHFGVIFSQKVQVRQFVCWHHFFSISKRIALKPAADGLLVVLRYALTDGAPCAADKQQARMLRHSYGMYAAAGDGRCSMDFSPGEFAWFDIAAPPEIFPGIPVTYNASDPDHRSRLRPRRICDPCALNMSGAVLDRVEKILYPGVDTPENDQDEMVDREEQLSALFNQYFEDRDLYRKRWRESGQLEITDLEDYVLEHLAEGPDNEFSPIALRRVLRKMQLSEFNFRILMQQEYNTNWKRFVLGVRMRRAAELLIHKLHMSMADISFVLGYSERTHFTRTFHSYYGMTPKHYRLLYSGTR